jgi:hypothetical protein
MKKIRLAGIVSVTFLLVSCGYQKHYVKSDYSLYRSDFKLPVSSALRTDGVYILSKIWTSQDGGVERIATDRKIYKFYPNGQVNLILDTYHVIKNNEGYVSAFNESIVCSKSNKSATLFEGYYNIEERRMVVQRMVTPRKLFSYDYFLLEKDSLIQVSSIIKGRGKIQEKYFTNHYKASYTFVPTVGDYINPNW